MEHLSRRRLLQALAALPAASSLARFRALAAPERGRLKIRDIQAMMIQDLLDVNSEQIGTDWL